jgi:hypothetical protein
MPRAISTHVYPFFHNRALIFILSLGGAIIAIVVASSCEFYSFQSITNRPWPGLEEPFTNAVSATVGLFSYEITESTEPGEENLGCKAFDGRFSDFPEGNELWEAAQYCVVFAFLTSVFALLINLFEMICCSFFCSFIFASTLLLMAGALQACTFMVIGGADAW